MLARFAYGASGAREAARRGAAVVVVDAFRASTSVCALVSRGVRVAPAASLEKALAIEAEYRIGERGSAKVEGFDFGNSPVELAAANLEPGKTAALTTTNGTRVLEAAEGAAHVFTGAFANATALAEELRRMELEVVVVACGWEGKRSLEDELAAGAILSRLEGAGVSLDERAGRMAREYRSRPNTDALRATAARRLRRLGHAADVDFCLREDTLPVVPILIDGVFMTVEPEYASLTATEKGGS